MMQKMCPFMSRPIVPYTHPDADEWTVWEFVEVECRGAKCAACWDSGHGLVCLRIGMGAVL